MTDDCIVDFDNLLKKGYNELGIYSTDNSLNHKNMITLANNFSTYFTDVSISSPYIIVLKTIAYYLQSNHSVMTKNKIYDFFITSYKFVNNYLGKINDNQSNSKSNMADNIIFEICNDILSNYDFYDDSIKIQIPNLIADIVAILFFKSDPYGKKISIYQIKSYYIAKKESLINHSYFYPSKILDNSVSSIEDINTTSSSNMEENNKSEGLKIFNSNSDIVLSDKKFIDSDMVFRITQITKRDNNSVKQSLTTLSEKEIRKLYDICNNYNKIIKYSKYDNLKDFKFEIENELKRSLSDKQIRHSQISIKKVQFYIENILDSKFEPHLTHGINHVKHNFEYGYRLVGLLSNSKTTYRKNK
jgi:hypothetical protein